MANRLPFWSGKDLKLLFLLEVLNGPPEKLELTSMSLEVTVLGEDVQEDVNGEERARFDTIIDGYGINIQGKQEKCDLLKRFLEVQANRDTRRIPEENVLGIVIYPRDGSRVSFEAREITLGLWAFNVGGRKERNAMTVPLRAAYFDPMPV